ncbi:MAG: dihydropteroate synthase [Acidobacteriota bacterium]|nr:dihydropteroate synthase [Acidobacteriota bacterium]
MFWDCGRYRLNLAERPLIMGILNATPDSFSDGYHTLDSALAHAQRLVLDGADILDVGGESTRPGSESVSTAEELERVTPLIETLRQRYDLPLSVDTQKPEVARAAIEAGADIVNGVSASLDYEAFTPVLAETGVGFVAMHMQNRPRTMQVNPEYTDVVAEVAGALDAAADHLAAAGVAGDRILFDPGIGFGKTLTHNLALLNGLEALMDRLQRPLLIGISRKSWLTHLLDVPRNANPELDAYTMVASTRLPFPAAAVHRVHNVKWLKRALVLAGRIH